MSDVLSPKDINPPTLKKLFERMQEMPPDNPQARLQPNEYVDILGFTTFRISSMDANTVFGYAISGVYADMNDPALRRGQVARLVPWS